MTRDETIALWSECEATAAAALSQGKSLGAAHNAARRVWNDWAERLLRERVEKGGIQWGTDRFLSGSLVKHSDEEREWRLAAAVEFSGYTFGKDESGPAILNVSPLPHGALLNRQAHRPVFETDFSGFVFPGAVSFEGVQFERGTSFGVAQFHDGVTFEKAVFHRTAFFGGAEFRGWAWFSEARFLAEAQFWGAQFLGETGFPRTQVGTSGDHQAVLDFTRALFSLDVNLACIRAYGNVSFHQANFSAYATLKDAIFDKDVDFGALKSTGVFDFSGVVFKQVPEFVQANFGSPPMLGNVSINLPRYWRKHDKRNVGKYRAIRTMAVQGLDHQTELAAFKGEVRSRRGTVDTCRHGAFWFGLAYDALSDFGISIWRPLVLWLLSIPAFAVAYLINAEKLAVNVNPCSDGTLPWLKALIFSLKNAILFVSWDREQIQAAYTCLYGQQAFPTANALMQAAQSMLSGVLIFLLILALRNQFKIK
jgi:hypothetical protein